MKNAFPHLSAWIVPVDEWTVLPSHSLPSHTWDPFFPSPSCLSEVMHIGHFLAKQCAVTMSSNSARRVSKHHRAPLPLSCTARRDPSWHRDYRALTNTHLGSWLLCPHREGETPEGCVVLVSTIHFPCQHSGDEGRGIPVLSGSGKGSHCTPAAELPRMEPLGSVASALTGIVAVSTVLVWGDGPAWCEMHLESVATMRATAGLQWFWH